MSNSAKVKMVERSRVEARFIEMPVPFDYQVEWYEDGTEHHIGKLWDRAETVIRPSYTELLVALRMRDEVRPRRLP